MKEKILKLRKEGKSYNEIKELLGCSKGTISYHCGEGQVEKTNLRLRKYKINNPLKPKLDKFNNRVRDFQRKRKNGTFIEGRDYTITTEEVLIKIGMNPICYLTGRSIDLNKSSSYHLDHIIPIHKGGLSDLNNLGITCKYANLAKRDLMLSEFIDLCKEILEFQGYSVNKIGK